MPLLPERLRILTFPQRINGNQLEVNVLVLPTQRLLNDLAAFDSQLQQGTVVDLPSFIQHSPQLEIKIIKGLSAYPFSDPTVLEDDIVIDSFPARISFPENIASLYEALHVEFKLKNSLAPKNTGAGDPLGNIDGIRKYLPHTYRNAFNFTNPRTEFAKTDDSYHCAIKKTDDKKPFVQSGNDLTWGRVIAFCLRQPLLAEKMGLVFKQTITLPAANYFENGGWIYFNLINHTDFGITDANRELQLKQYAARIPSIDMPRPLFAAVLFPVTKGPAIPAGDFDTLKIEAADYDDGFAKIVHAMQPVSANLLSEEPDELHVQKDAGFRLGWDDEQILIWQNRQVLADPATLGKRLDAPLGVFSYRVDVKETGADSWNSLVLTQSKVDLVLGKQQLAPAGTIIETGVQVFPSKVNAGAAYWLPSYFTQWYGPSLVLPDPKAAELDESGAIANPGLYSDSRISSKPDQKGGLYRPLLPRNCELKYGRQYSFRVRLADLTGGGPLVADDEINDAPSTTATETFKRWVAPKQVTVLPLDAQTDPNGPTKIFYTGDQFDVLRPRLGYPALLFTQLDTETAFQQLVDDRAFLHTGKTGLEKIKEQRAVGGFDPDTDQLLVLVELRTLKMDNRASANQKEAFIPLYTTTRQFPNDAAAAFRLQLEYRDANVIDFGNAITLGDLAISQTEIDEGTAIVLPRSRDIRITLLPVCSAKPALPDYFGFKETLFHGKLIRTGEPTQFFVREDAVAELNFFKKDLESKKLQGIFLQPDPVQVINAQTLVTDMVAGKDAVQNSVVQRLATQLGLGCTGLSLIGNPGERIHFGCSNRIRHTLAPDNSSISFATSAELFNHWICVVSFEINRDWTWDGLSDAGITISREKSFTGEATTLEDEVIGAVELKKTASRLISDAPDRSYTRIVFIDAVEPKKDLSKPSTTAHPYPNTIDLLYTIAPAFISSVPEAAEKAQAASADLQLPTTVIPRQVPKIVAAGIALSPYAANAGYSETAARERYLWFEFDAPIEDPNDSYFARVLTYAPDPLLSYPNTDQLLVKQEDPPLPIGDALIRVITKDHGNDNAGLDAMQLMTAETPNPGTPLLKISQVHYLLPLPKGLHNESPQLFGFFTYELRVGHTHKIWCTAHGRFGHPARINSVQHPAPALKCLVSRDADRVVVSAQYAQAVFNGKNVTSKPPKTEIWCMLYAQVKQADGKQFRNILLSETMLAYRPKEEQVQVASFLAKRNYMTVKEANKIKINLDVPLTGQGGWSMKEIYNLLEQFNLRGDIGLSVLAVEMMPRYEQYIYKPDYPINNERPLSQGLGNYRILRTSRLVAAPELCCETCG
ncbi:MAG: hypothetical protein ABIU63_03590 [Chitinophagaceae bacterium]